MPYHPHPHIIICTLFISSIDYNVFIVLQCHLKDLLCRKVTTAYTSASTDARAALAPLSGGTRVSHWQSARRLWPDTRRLQLPLDECFRLVLPYHVIQHATDGTDPNDPPRMGGKKYYN